MELAVIYADDAVVAVGKPPGIVVHPTYRNWTGTLLNGLLAGYQEPRIVTRLDRDTSGLVLVALGADMHARMQRDSIAGRMTKDYVAVVRGTPDPAAGSIIAPLARSAADRRIVVIDPAGQASHTDYEVLSSGNGFALVRCRLLTGRTHQIRVHMASIGHPVVGDLVYGTADEGMPRQALHAWRVAFPHPTTRALVELESPPPPDLQQFLTRQNLML